MVFHFQDIRLTAAMASLLSHIPEIPGIPQKHDEPDDNGDMSQAKPLLLECQNLAMLRKPLICRNDEISSLLLHVQDQLAT